MFKYLLTFLLFMSMYNAYAQSRQTFKGVVYNTEGVPLSGVNISLYDADSLKTGGVVTNADGNFAVNITGRTRYAYISHVGYLPYKVVAFIASPVKIYLSPATRQLAEISVKSKRPFIEQQFDRLTVNVDGDPKTGLNAVDVLKKVPGLAVVNETSLSFEGKSVTVYLDGKLTRLSGRELMALLANTPSVSISQIEVMHTPSAKFDAGTDGGVINIKTIKRSKPGYDATLSITGGHGWKYFSGNNAYAGLNYRKNKEYLYGSYSYGFGKQSQEIETTTWLQGIGQSLRDSTRYKTPYRDHNLRLGWDHYMNKHDVFGALITAYDGNYNPGLNSVTGIFNTGTQQADSSRIANNQRLTHNKGVNLNLNYKLVLDSAIQQELSMDADAGTFRYQNNNELVLQLIDRNNSAVGAAQQLLQSGKTSTHIYSFKTDYSQKLYKGNFESGIKASYVDIDNQFLSQSGFAGSILNDNGSNDFRYKETIVAGYISSKQIIGKLTLQGGLRGEQTFTDGESGILDSLVNWRYFNLFPNIIAGYKLKNGLLSASYSRRIGRPYYNYLNPFRIARGTYSVYEGNPYLKPSFTDAYRLSYSFKNKLSFTASYSKVSDVITDLILLNEQTKISTALKANLNSNHNGGLSINYNSKLFDILNITYTVGSSYSRYRFLYANELIAIKQLTAYTYLDNQVNLPKQWWFDVYVYAQSRVTYGNQVNLPLFTTQLSGGKKLFNGKGNLSVYINDIFFTGVQRSRARYANVAIDTRSRYDSRNIRASLSYNISNAKVNVRNRSSGSADEQRRNH